MCDLLYKGWMPAEWLCVSLCVSFTTMGICQKSVYSWQANKAKPCTWVAKFSNYMIAIPDPSVKLVLATFHLTHIRWVKREIPLDVEVRKLIHHSLTFLTEKMQQILIENEFMNDLIRFLMNICNSALKDHSWQDSSTTWAVRYQTQMAVCKVNAFLAFTISLSTTT